MARRVFFSFHFQEDAWRVSQVRNIGVIRGWEAKPFHDAASWESVRRAGDRAIKDWIDRQLDGTSVTVVLVGAQTAQREYVKYEIKESHRRGNGLLGVRIHKMKNHRRETGKRGHNPFRGITTIMEETGFLGLWSKKARRRLSDIYPIYDWVDDNGYENIGLWIAESAAKVGR